MTIPTSSLYPDEFDSDNNLYLVHDALRLNLLEDYNPGDTSITIDDTPGLMALFPDTGQITLTEQCSEPDERAISFYYGSKTDTTFDELELLPGFPDVVKPKKITHVTQNVMADHHNNIKNAIIAIQEFVGIRGTVDLRPFGPTLEGRINFLRKLVLSPKAWFTADKTIGLVPLEVTFKDLSFRLGTDGTAGNITYIWDFGDNTTSVISLISQISVISVVPPGTDNVIVEDLDGQTVTKTYLTPGKFNTTLTVSNDFGTDTLTFYNYINARIPAPNEAVIEIIPRTNQILTPGTPTGGPYTVPPVLRSAVNTLIDIEVPPGENPFTPGRSYAGELLNGSGSPIDPVVTYNWQMQDDLTHSHISTARASFSVGGIYDIVLRVDTQFGAYRITSYRNSLDIVEKTNLWLWNYVSPATLSLSSGQKEVRAYEFGILSETFKQRTNASLAIDIDDSFLDGVDNEEQQKREFNRNNGFALRGTNPSGLAGLGLLFWATGRTAVDPVSAEEVAMVDYNGFADVYISHPSFARQWNWLSLSSPSKAYFLFGGVPPPIAPNTSPTNQTMTALDLVSLTTTDTVLNNTKYLGGAGDLKNNVTTYNPDGTPTYGHMSVYRSTWKDSTGFFLRNDGVGPFFRLKSFYRTEGTTIDPVQSIRKLPDMPGSTKVEGQLVPLASGVYFFNNSGAVAAYNDTTGVWQTGAPGANAAAFRNLQDMTVAGFDDSTNTLLATSDNDRRAYLSFDYSPNAFIQFNEADLTFRSLGSRPAGDQWQMHVY